MKGNNASECQKVGGNPGRLTAPQNQKILSFKQNCRPKGGEIFGGGDPPVQNGDPPVIGDFEETPRSGRPKGDFFPGQEITSKLLREHVPNNVAGIEISVPRATKFTKLQYSQMLTVTDNPHHVSD